MMKPLGQIGLERRDAEAADVHPDRGEVAGHEDALAAPELLLANPRDLHLQRGPDHPTHVRPVVLHRKVPEGRRVVDPAERDRLDQRRRPVDVQHLRRAHGGGASGAEDAGPHLRPTPAPGGPGALVAPDPREVLVPHRRVEDEEVLGLLDVGRDRVHGPLQVRPHVLVHAPGRDLGHAEVVVPQVGIPQLRLLLRREARDLVLPEEDRADHADADLEAPGDEAPQRPLEDSELLKARVRVAEPTPLVADEDHLHALLALVKEALLQEILVRPHLGHLQRIRDFHEVHWEAELEGGGFLRRIVNRPAVVVLHPLDKPCDVGRGGPLGGGAVAALRRPQDATHDSTAV